ncbi:MAG: hypothetical protein WBD22_14665 [Pyrinomonadaceae bacterium]
MIYLVSLAVIVAAVGAYLHFRSTGLAAMLLDIAISAAFGWLAGLLLGVFARIGMWTIPFFNGAEPRFSFDGSIEVILTFSLFGIGLGIVYELAFRKLLSESGFLFGVLVTLLTWYPLGKQGVDLLNFSPSWLPLLFFTLSLIGLMFVPFTIVLAFLLGRWHRFRDLRNSNYLSTNHL